VRLLSSPNRGRGGVDDHVVTGKSDGATHRPITRNVTSGDACSPLTSLVGVNPCAASLRITGASRLAKGVSISREPDHLARRLRGRARRDFRESLRTPLCRRGRDQPASPGRKGNRLACCGSRRRAWLRRVSTPEAVYAAGRVARALARVPVRAARGCGRLEGARDICRSLSTSLQAARACGGLLRA